MYYNDHLAAAGKKRRSRFCNLVDTAIKLDETEKDCLCILAEKGKSKCYKTVLKEESHKSFNYLLDAAFMFSEEEERRLHAGKENSKCPKTISEEEEENQTRSSVVKRQAYDSSSSLNEIPTDSETEAFQNYNQWLSSPLFIMTKILQNYPRSEPMVYDEEQGAEKGEYFKTISEDSEKRLLDPLHQEPRSSLKNFFTKTYKRNHKKLNMVSTSSSLLNTDESETKKRKRRSVTQRMSSGKSKKAKVASFSQTARETPEWLFEATREMKGAQDPRLILERTLSASDVNSGQSRLLIPFKKLLRNDFLTRAECGAIEKVAVTRKDEENTGVGTILVSQRSGKWGLRFKKWVMKKKSGNGTLSYALNWDWNLFVERNNLKAGDKIRLWTFRCRGVLCFGLET